MAQYSDSMKKAVLRYIAWNHSATEAAKHFGIPVQTVTSWKNGEGINDDILMTDKEERKEFAKVAREKAAMASAFMTPEKMEESKLADLVTAFKTLLAVADTQEGIASPDAVAMGPDNAVRASAMAKLAALNIPIEGLTHEASE